ncbi:MAG: hypothetical protein AAGI44_17850 [Pseudomonadota bacterium]
MPNTEPSTPEQRIEWFCDHFGCAAPELEYENPEKREGPLLTDELMEWTKREGVSMDWLFCGDNVALLASHRIRYCEGSLFRRATDPLGMLPPDEIKVLTAGLTATVEHGADLDDVMKGVYDTILEMRRTQATSEPEEAA